MVLITPRYSAASFEICVQAWRVSLGGACTKRGRRHGRASPTHGVRREIAVVDDARGNQRRLAAKAVAAKIFARVVAAPGVQRGEWGGGTIKVGPAPCRAPPRPGPGICPVVLPRPILRAAKHDIAAAAETVKVLVGQRCGRRHRIKVVGHVLREKGRAARPASARAGEIEHTPSTAATGRPTPETYLRIRVKGGRFKPGLRLVRGGVSFFDDGRLHNLFLRRRRGRGRGRGWGRGRGRGRGRCWRRLVLKYAVLQRRPCVVAV